MDHKLLAKNKKAYFDYEIIEKFEAGMILQGPEVKSVKAGHIQLKGSYATAENGRVYTENLHISPYKSAPIAGQDPMRKRELLLRKKEIGHLAGEIAKKGFTLIPLEIILKKGLVKAVLGLCRGKKAHDKRAVIKKRDVVRDIDQGLKKFSR